LKANRKNVAIIVASEAGDDEARFVVSEAWPVKYEPSPLNAQGNDVFIELLELANEGIERVS
jgi:phage tail-like protein